jgi:chromosome segregation ATPase
MRSLESVSVFLLSLRVRADRDPSLQSLKDSLRVRMRKWIDFRRHIAFRCKVTFQYHLSNRGYYGKVMFDHVNQTLELKVQTDDVNATQGETQGAARDKDPRSLSGGEKSFSTICLLLAMWEAIGSPIRCLGECMPPVVRPLRAAHGPRIDEFDVFMDAVNRRISAKMIVRSILFYLWAES